MMSRPAWKYRESRWTWRSVILKAMAISSLRIITTLLFITSFAPFQSLSNMQCRQRLANALLPRYTFRRIQEVSYERLFSNEGTNQKKKKISSGNTMNRNSILTYENIQSSTKIGSRRDDNDGFPSTFDTSPLPIPSVSNFAPLKVMVFIDGTWLYYSIFEREAGRDVMAQKLGKNWKNTFKPDWSRLPTVACQALLQDPKSKWSAIMPVGIDDSSNPASKLSPARPIEVARVSVYSSMHRDTPKDSYRYMMFSEMIKAGFDVNMMETKGRGEKCVDIQLAVDMLYYATVPDAYDVALLLTGDRDFLPAVIRCRQKGRRIGLVSMRTGSLAFEVTPNLKDYDTIFLEDYLDQWMRKKTPKELSNYSLFGRRKRPSRISSYTLNFVVKNFIEKSGEPHVSSRDIGRHLKALKVRGDSMLDEIKEVFGGLYQFLVLSKIYLVTPDSRRAVKAFWVALDHEKNVRKERGHEERLNDDEKKFLKYYKQWMPVDKSKEYDFTVNEPDLSLHQPSGMSESLGDSQGLDGSATPVDYNTLTIPELKQICREKGLKISAKKKQELVERIESFNKNENLQMKNGIDESSPESYLISLVHEYLQASGGQATSRDVGRYLAANKASPQRRQKETSAGRKNRGLNHALNEMKENYGSLNEFVRKVPNFIIQPTPGPEFDVCIAQRAKVKQI